MSKINMVRNIKELFPDYVLLVKIGTFYESYNNDSSIISYLCNYKIKEVGSKDKICGFPTVSLNKVKYLLEQRNINYLIVDKSHNYEELEKMNYKKKNKYNELLTISNEHIDKISRIEKIRNHLLNDSSKLNTIEDLLFER